MRGTRHSEEQIIGILKQAERGQAFFVGVAVGAGAVESYHRIRENRTAELFSRRLRCNELANKYAEKESTDEQSVGVEQVEYSAASNSCVGYFFAFHTGPLSYERWRVINLLSDEELYRGECREDRDCGNGKDMSLRKEAQLAFRQAVKGEEVNVKNLKPPDIFDMVMEHARQRQAALAVATAGVLLTLLTVLYLTRRELLARRRRR
jgi:hypothetical protein